MFNHNYFATVALKNTVYMSNKQLVMRLMTIVMNIALKNTV